MPGCNPHLILVVVAQIFVQNMGPSSMATQTRPVFSKAEFSFPIKGSVPKSAIGPGVSASRLLANQARQPVGFGSSIQPKLANDLSHTSVCKSLHNALQAKFKPDATDSMIFRSPTPFSVPQRALLHVVVESRFRAVRHHLQRDSGRREGVYGEARCGGGGAGGAARAGAEGQRRAARRTLPPRGGAGVRHPGQRVRGAA